ncbi:MAG: hypothetical protein EXR72_02740 [Myxococcales bacterium]|nr:hypothetical protein [Myxococcales bacterium]
MRAAPPILALLLAASVFPPPARAEGPGPDEAEQARAHFEAGNGLYKLGKYREAARHFAAGYDLVHLPKFLLNCGQAYRRLNDLPRARESFRRYRDEAPPDDPDLPQVGELIAELDRELAQKLTITDVARPPAEAKAIVVVAPPPAPGPSFAVRHWWIFPVAAVLLAAAAIGIGFAARPAEADCASFSFGCLDARR